ncbi:hypothetical protein IU500_34145 [Nocardia terpenica]|uniref:hypothetical protein n=1 Tax=Nocardia terpenica TaxID=455432 RepID=UPI001893673E|nr:hypothetical protein [Nocardia terpenica]MBF6066015.1 hypothetical protein [Nocardia terpenica]MBF6109058.1 hypothetical protein [Nocardia terpenica]MBF6116259.1 hypothetical protein [Nocardia terpenica]MBF6123260.1 hypothetical protein [Nocardia terpenica]MBF6156557.1 hypothetical protein [Nocardia terpenica]
MCPAAADGFGPSVPPDGESIPIRPLHFRELLDLPFALIQSRIRALAGLIGAGWLIAAVASFALTALGAVATHGSDTGTLWSAIVSVAVFAWLLRWYIRGVAVSIGLGQVFGGPLAWRGAVAGLGANFGPLLLDRLIYSVLGVGVPVLGALLVITLPPALAWLARLRAARLVAMPALVAESVSYRAAVARAKMLAGGAQWRLAGLWLALRGLVWVLAVPLLGIPLFFSDVTGTRRWTVTALIIGWVLLIVALAEAVESAAAVVAYVDRRCRREALDIAIPVSDNGFAGARR